MTEHFYLTLVWVYMRLLIVLLFLSHLTFSQSDILVMGNHSNVCLSNPNRYEYQDSLPSNLDNFDAILIFSSSSSLLSELDLNRLLEYLYEGGGLYCGAENWPLQAEANQITFEMFKKTCFDGNNDGRTEINESHGNLNLLSLEEIPAGKTTVAFPLDHRLNVEVWLDDQPLIASAKVNNGRLILDGGYSRFYCDVKSKDNSSLMLEIIKFLLN